MSNLEKGTDQVRNLACKIRLAGALAELNPLNKGVGKDGITYISFSGAIQCGETAVFTARFKCYLREKKSDGSDSEQYKKGLEWYNSAVPMTKNKDNPTYVDMIGSLSANDYVSADNRLVEGFNYNIQFFNTFTEYAYQLDLEGYIASVADETVNDDFTGRKKMRVIGKDFYNNVLDIKDIYVPSNLAKALRENGYEKGRTALMYITFMPNDGKPKAKGFGEQRTQGTSHLEKIVTGGNTAYDVDSKDSLNTAVVKDMLNERAVHLKEIQDNGYLGKKNSSPTNNRNGFGNKPTSSPSNSFEEVSDDEIPF